MDTILTPDRDAAESCISMASEVNFQASDSGTIQLLPGPKRRFVGLVAIRPESGANPTCQESSNRRS